MEQYKYGFVTQIESESLSEGLSESVIEQISQKKNEPQWILDLRLKAYRYWLTMKEPEWAKLKYPLNRLSKNFLFLSA